MPLAKNRELITVTDQAHEHLRKVVSVMKKNGLPVNGSMLASQAILAIPLPQVRIPAEKKRKARKVAETVAAPAL